MNMRRRKQRAPTADGRERRAGILKVIVEYRDEHGYPPTIREIADATGASSTSNVSHHLLAMERQGVIERTPGASRGIRVVKDDVLY